MAIHVLDRHTAELIAAGEVVERPASVVKELLENAIDAGAKTVTVEIRRGGTELIQIQDDGSGIEAEDIPLAFIRHATSKVRTQEDLEAISTLGFRGEALASIASVAKVELLTCTRQDEYASLYRIEGGQEMRLEAAARPVGTTITVRDLFYNTPARMKFLKKDTSEANYVTETVSRLALSCPEVSVRYIREGKQVFHTPGDGQLKSAVWAVLGAQFGRELEEVEGELRQYKVAGFVTPPRACRASRAMQFFFINGRFVKNRTMMAALEQAYRGMVMHGKFPGCVLMLSMPPQLVDVNVHPAKTEVRFAHEKDIFDAVYQSVKASLLKAAASHSQFSMPVKRDAEMQEEVPFGGAVLEATKNNQPVQSAEIIAGQALARRNDAVYRPGGAQQTTPVSAVVSGVQVEGGTLASKANVLYETQPKPPVPGYITQIVPKTQEFGLDIEPVETFDNKAQAFAGVLETQPMQMQAAENLPESKPAQTSFAPPEESAEALELCFVGEVFRTYILAQWGEVLCVIDKHAAHERIIYEKLVATKQEAGSQQLLVPVQVGLSATEKNALLQNTEALLAAGIEVDDFGGNTVLVRGVPADVEPDSISDLVIEVAQRLAVNSKDNLNEKTEWVMHSVSCRAAIKAGDKTSPQQLLRLAQDILQGDIPPFCPHGRPVVLEITRKELEKQFGRLG